MSGLLPRLLLALLVAMIAFSTPGRGDDQRDAALDALFEKLRVANSPAAAQRLDQQIWMHWTSPSDPELASRMTAVMEARSLGDLDALRRLLNQLVIDYPDYAEGWNQRATMHYMVGDLEASLADCARVLALEPRHFGALSGRALIYLALGKRGLALKDMAAALAIHPFLSERQLFPELLPDPAQRNMTRV